MTHIFACRDLSSRAVVEASWEVQTPTPNQPPCGAQGRRLLGPAALRACPFASLPGQAQARLGSGGYCRRSGIGGPQTCLPVAWLKWGPSAAHLHQLKLKTLARGQASRGGRQEASSEAASSGRLARRRRDQGGGTSRGTHDASHDDRGQACARQAPACAVSLFPLWCKGGKHRTGHRTKVTIPVKRDQDQQSGRMEVTVETKTASSSESLAIEDQL